MKKLVIVLLIVCFSCGDDPIPKPNAFLRLEYPEAKYQRFETELPFSFSKNEQATKVEIKPLRGTQDSYGLTLEYPSLKGSIYLTYKAVQNNKERLVDFLRDAQNFTQQHTKKADEIAMDIYENSERKVFGMFYEVGGNAASQSQFYVTDSVNHFFTGSLYFYAKPNYDSLLPAAHYLQNDIKKIMESIEWK